MYFQERSLFGSQNSAQKVLDGVTMFTDVISTVGYQPKKMISDWAADKIAPSYWRPNNEIKVGAGFQIIFAILRDTVKIQYLYYSVLSLAAYIGFLGLNL